MGTTGYGAEKASVNEGDRGCVEYHRQKCSKLGPTWNNPSSWQRAAFCDWSSIQPRSVRFTPTHLPAAPPCDERGPGQDDQFDDGSLSRKQRLQCHKAGCERHGPAARPLLTRVRILR